MIFIILSRVRSSPFINFQENIPSPRLLGTFFPSPFVSFLENLHPPLLLEPPRFIRKVRIFTSNEIKGDANKNDTSNFNHKDF